MMRFSLAFGGLLFVSAMLLAEPVRKEVRWAKVPYSGGYIVEVEDLENSKKIIDQIIVNPPFVFRAEPGRYRLRVITLNRWGHSESTSKWVNFDIPVPPPKVTPIAPQILPKMAMLDEVIPLPKEGSIIVPMTQKKGQSPLGKMIKSYLYSEIVVYNLPFFTWNTQNRNKEALFDQSLPFYFSLLQYRIGFKDIRLRGLSVGFRSEVIPLSTRLLYDYVLYSIPHSFLYSLDIGYKLELAPHFYLAINLYPIASLERILTITYGAANTVMSINPLNYGLEDIVVPESVKNSGEPLYISLQDSFLGASLSFQYNVNQHIVMSTLAYFWAKHQQYEIDWISWAFEVTIGLRF